VEAPDRQAFLDDPTLSAGRLFYGEFLYKLRGFIQHEFRTLPEMPIILQDYYPLISNGIGGQWPKGDPDYKSSRGKVLVQYEPA
jgi:hypothetical protein